MELLKRQPTAKLPAEWFTGDAWADVTHRGTDDVDWLEHVDDEYGGPRRGTRAA